MPASFGLSVLEVALILALGGPPVLPFVCIGLRLWPLHFNAKNSEMILSVWRPRVHLLDYVAQTSDIKYKREPWLTAHRIQVNNNL